MEDSVAEAVAQERHAQDLRNQQVLQVLKEKDVLIQQLQTDQGYLHDQVCITVVRWKMQSPTSVYSKWMILQSRKAVPPAIQEPAQYSLTVSATCYLSYSEQRGNMFFSLRAYRHVMLCLCADMFARESAAGIPTVRCQRSAHMQGCRENVGGIPAAYVSRS